MSDGRKEGKIHRQSSLPKGVIYTAVEVAVSIWAVGLMGYYYYAKGYWGLLGQIWRLLFG